MTNERYYTELAAAFVRGKLPGLWDVSAPDVIARGLAAGLKLHKFKRNGDLPRVRAVLGAVRGMAPASLLDIGSGRGTFLWPLLDVMTATRITTIDLDPRRCADLAAVQRGGVANFSVARMDARRLGFADKCVDVVTLLEVAEHLREPSRAFAESIRVARRFVIVSVPSKEDDNPEHIHVFDRAGLEGMLLEAGARRVRFDSVLNHRIAIATVGG